ncbi:MAG: hypothetical protein M1821_003671 [Bathelium mastoideum]|nr:MAG: hypothetical protein M1821_003671 [Bathelium mastoideum]
MMSTRLLLGCGLFGAALAAPLASTPTVYLAGDSTMAKGGDGAGTNTNGWGQYLGYSLNIPVVNDAIAGRSARSFWEEGRFQLIANVVQSGDFIVIEFGHNDGGSLTPTDNGRSDCPGEANQTCTSTYNGATDTVHTFNWYLIEAAQLYLAKGAHVVISSQTPDNPWETGTFVGTASRFVQYAQDTATTLGSASATYVNHFAYTDAIFDSLGATVVDGYYPVDHTHTSPTGADTVSKAFVRGLQATVFVLHPLLPDVYFFHLELPFEWELARMMNTGLGVRLTPNNSPSVRYPASVRSPIRSSHDELSLSLKRVIGSTTGSPNAFDCQASRRRFAYTAGAAAVIADVDNDLQITQRFFRARSAASPPTSNASTLRPATPTRTLYEQEARNRTVSSLRDAGVGRDPAESPSRWADSPGPKPWAAKERVKAATAVSFSPDGRFLAVGETGYKPRVLIFAADDDRSSDLPLAVMAEHSYGVQCVAFSPDSQYLASLGSINDGFLHIWRVGPRGNASLHSSAKCTTSVRQIAWVGSVLIAVGIRYIKVWRLDNPSEPASPRKARPGEFGSPLLLSPSAKSLPGRNVILGDLLESTFTAVVAISSQAAAVCSDRGDICIVDVANSQQTIRRVANVGFPVLSTACDGERLVVAGETRKRRTLDLAQLTDNTCDPSIALTVKSPSTKRAENVSYTAALACFGAHLIIVDSHDGVEISREHHFEDVCNTKTSNVNAASSNQAKDLSPTPDSTPAQVKAGSEFLVQKLPGHGAPVLGVQAIPIADSLGSSFFTWSCNGLIHFWSLAGVLNGSMCVPLGTESLALESPNELKIVRAFPNLNYFATGDKYGVLRIVDREAGRVIFDAQAHSGEILDIVVFEMDGSTLVCSAGRDRVVQIFEHRRGETVLSQSLDEHVSVVNGLLFTPKNSRLLSSSFDRTIVIRDRYIQDSEDGVISAFVISRTINLKSAPVAMGLMEDESSLMVSCTDRSVMIYDTDLRKAIHTFKASDTEKGDPVVLSALAHWRPLHGPSLIAGTSSTDKSIRLYQEDGTLVGRDWGHTEGVTDIAIVYEDDVREKACVVTVAADGTIFLWAASHDRTIVNGAFDRADALIDQPLPSEHRTNKPLRRLLSHSDLASFRPASESATPRTSPTATPNRARSPKLRQRASRMSLAQTPKPEPVSSSTITATTTTTTNPFAPSRTHRSPTSPTSPKTHVRTNTDFPTRSLRRPSLDIRHRTKSANNLKSPQPPSSLSTFSSSINTNIGNANPTDSTTQIVRALRAYRRALARAPISGTGPTALNVDAAREVERELQLTARAVAEKAAWGAGVGEETLVRLFDEFGERIVKMLDERVEKRIRGVGILEEEESAGGKRMEEGNEERRGSV